MALPSTSIKEKGESLSKSGHTANWFEAGSLTQGIPGTSVQSTSPCHSRSNKGNKFAAYVIFYSGKVAVFNTWPQVQPWITGHGPAVYSGFPTVATTEAALIYARAKGWTADTTPPTPTAPPSDRPFFSYEECPLNSPFDHGPCLECNLNVCGVPGALFKSFPARQAAENALWEAHRDNLMKSIPHRMPLACI
ncbi:hypothetical protein C8J57DRAFT_1235796 [Mycena rebaudengoi]|nr:hypothetical protein C8J57DRAFT_1235796 [Mycena rebaudengoi]